MADKEQSWTSKKYNEYYNSYVPWLEDKYLAWFGENKTSYTTKGILTSFLQISPILCPSTIATHRSACTGLSMP